MDLSGFGGAIAGATIALAGVGLGELGQGRRARTAAIATAAARQEDRRAELWHISLPAATRVQSLFAELVRKTSLPPFDLSFEQPPFDDVFPDWWGVKELELRTDVALIPSAQFRSWIETVNEGINVSWHLVRKVGYAEDQERAVLKATRIGFEVVSAWLRDEKTIDPDLLNRVTDLEASIKEVDELYKLERGQKQ